MRIGRISLPTRHLFGVNSMIPEMLETDGLEGRCRNRIKRQD
jgi:hypothetical protein